MLNLKSINSEILSEVSIKINEDIDKHRCVKSIDRCLKLLFPYMSSRGRKALASKNINELGEKGYADKIATEVYLELRSRVTIEDIPTKLLDVGC